MLNTIILPSFLLRRSLAKNRLVLREWSVRFEHGVSLRICGLSPSQKWPDRTFLWQDISLTERNRLVVFTVTAVIWCCSFAYMSNIHSVDGWWKAKVIIWSELLRVNLPIWRHICEQFASNMPFFPGPQFALSFCICSKVLTANEKLSLWAPTECSCKLVFVCDNSSFYLT